LPSSRDEDGKFDDVEQTLVTFLPEEQYAHVTLTYLVDNVCVHASKQEDIRDHFMPQIDASTSESQQQALMSQMEEELG
jgi:hypothetical protein